MRPDRLVAVAACMIILVMGMGQAIDKPHASASHKDGAPAGYTGGFGEETCLSCHFDGMLNDPQGALTVTGLPAVYVPDSVYTLSISVSRPGLGRAGFSLATRFGNGRRAGSVVPVDDRVQLSHDTGEGSYATHSELGYRTTGDSAAWFVSWRAPSDTSAPVTLNLAANAANGDDSEFGDLIYAIEQTSNPVVKAVPDE